MTVRGLAKLKAMGAIRRFIFWEYARASWQYDVMVGLILVFIFVTPYYVNFRDQPKAASVVMLPAEQGVDAFHIETRLLSDVPPAERAAKATQLVRARFKNQVSIVRVEPIMGEEDEV